MKILNNFSHSANYLIPFDSKKDKSNQKFNAKNIPFGQSILVPVRSLFKEKWIVKDLPTGVGFEINRNCNANCKYCPNHDNPDRLLKIFMKTSLFKKAIRDLRKIWGRAAKKGFKFIDQQNNRLHNFAVYYHFFGEPLLDSRLEVLLRFTKRMLPNVKRKVFTNGIVLTPERLKSILKAGATEVIISRHTPNTAFMKNLTNIPDEMLENVHVNFPEEMGKSNRGGSLLGLGSEEDKSNSICSIADEEFTIGWSGDIYLCYDDFNREAVMGNINKSSIGKIWDSLKYNIIRKRLSKDGDRSVTPICQKCNRDDSVRLAMYDALDVKKTLQRPRMSLKIFDKLIDAKIPFSVIRESNESIKIYAMEKGIEIPELT